jgi:hypothetical protein
MEMVSIESISPPDAPVERSVKRHALFFFAGCFMARTDGCHVRAMQTLDLLVATGLDVTIYSYRRHPDWPWTASDVAACARRFPSARLVLDDGGSALRLVGRIKTALSLLGPRLRDRVLKVPVPRLTPGLDTLKVERRPDVLVASYATGLSHLNGLPDAKIIVDMHDVTSLEQVRLRSSRGLDWGALLALRKELGAARIGGRDLGHFVCRVLFSAGDSRGRQGSFRAADDRCARHPAEWKSGVRPSVHRLRQSLERPRAAEFSR